MSHFLVAEQVEGVDTVYATLDLLNLGVIKLLLIERLGGCKGAVTGETNKGRGKTDGIIAAGGPRGSRTRCSDRVSYFPWKNRHFINELKLLPATLSRILGHFCLGKNRGSHR